MVASQKLRRSNANTSHSGDAGGNKQGYLSKHQQQQREKAVQSYSDTMRRDTKAIGNGVFWRLFFPPMACALIGIVYVVMGVVEMKAPEAQLDPPDFRSLRTHSPDQHALPKMNPSGASNTTATTNAAFAATTQQQLDLPKWITDYVKWHTEMRAKYPGKTLFTSKGKDTPKLLVRTCLGICGGLHDRLGQLPWDLYLAMRTKRVLLIAWQRPRELEHFLVPPINDDGDDIENSHQAAALDWRVPDCDMFEDQNCVNFGFKDIRIVRSKVKELFDDQLEANPGEKNFWNVGFERAMVRAGAPSSPGAITSYFSDSTNTTEVFRKDHRYTMAKILRHRLLGHLDEHVLEERLEREGYYKDEPHWKPSDLHSAPSFGAIWDLFFRPSQEVRTEIVGALSEMNLLASSSSSSSGLHPVSKLPPTVDFSAVHCRVRHPKAHQFGEVVKGKNDRYPADKTGLPWIEGGPQRRFALETAHKALECAREIVGTEVATSPKPPIYFLSDSNDLVRHVAEELVDTSPGGYVERHRTNESWIYPPLLEVVRGSGVDGDGPVVARNTTLENAHIDKQKGRKPPDYYGTFVDLYIAMKARCVVYGIGFYAAFAAKLSGTNCTYLYAEETWGLEKKKSARVCPNHGQEQNGIEA